VITDATGHVVELAEYTPYGSLSHHEGAANVAHKFTGQRLDAFTTLYFYQARYYDPLTGRFTQADTIVPAPSDPQTLNRYSYVRNNPLRYTDPSGHGWFKKFFGMFLTIGLTLVGMPFIGALVGSAFSTFANGGNFSQFAISFGIGLAVGLVGGSVAGGLARGLGFNPAGLETALLRGGLSGALGGAGTAAAFGGDIGKGAWQGALGGAAIGGIVWGKNVIVTNQFLKNNVAWDSSTSEADKSTITQGMREAGQSPRGQIMLNRFMHAGRILNIHTWDAANARGTVGGNDMWLNPNANAYNDPNSSSPWAKTFDQATVFLHELGHNLGYSEASGNPPSALNVSYNENPYRGWIGSPQRTTYYANGRLPARQTFGDIDIWR